MPAKTMAKKGTKKILSLAMKQQIRNDINAEFERERTETAKNLAVVVIFIIIAIITIGLIALNLFG